GILDEHVEVAILIEDSGIEQLVLEFVAAALLVGLDKVAIGEGSLGILVEILHVRVGRGGVEVEVILLDVVAVVPLAVGQPEQELLENGILAVPEGPREAEELLLVADPPQPVLPPAIGPRAGLVVAEVVPGVPGVAVVLPHGAPLPIREIGPPLAPRHVPGMG